MNKSVIVYGPMECGKTRFAQRIAKHFGLDKIVDDWDIGQGFAPNGTLHITNAPMSGPSAIVRIANSSQRHKARCYSFDEVARQINAKIERTDWIPGDVQPVRAGVYVRQVFSGECFAHWNGKFWGMFAGPKCTPDDALRHAKCRSFVKTAIWRGLAEEPLPVKGGA